MADPHKIIASTSTVIITGVTLVGFILGGIIWLVALNANVSDLQRRVADLEKRPIATAPAADPIAAACVELARARAATDSRPGLTIETEKVMSDLGCARK